MMDNRVDNHIILQKEISIRKKEVSLGTHSMITINEKT